jgi:hypothetical protein
MRSMNRKTENDIDLYAGTPKNDGDQQKQFFFLNVCEYGYICEFYVDFIDTMHSMIRKTEYIDMLAP